MILHRALAALVLAVAMTGCSGGQNSTTQTQPQQTGATPAAAGASAAPAATATAEVASAGTQNAANLPLYPGAVKATTQFTKAITYCGYKMSMTMYQVPGLVAPTVADWYAGKIANAIRLNASASAGMGSSTNFELLDPGGAYGVAISQMHFSKAMENLAKRYGVPQKTTIGVLTYDPPISSDDLQTFAQAAGGDQTVKAAARARMKAKCGTNPMTVQK